VLEGVDVPGVRPLRAALRLRGGRLGEAPGSEGAGHRHAEAGQCGAAGHRGHGEAADEREGKAMSTRSGPYTLEIAGEEWWYQHDMMGDNFDGAVYYVKGPNVYLELPIEHDATGHFKRGQFAANTFCGPLPLELVNWLDRWSDTPPDQGD
jgi:hypothetical protein